MAKKELTHKRDMTFHVNRREYGDNIPATDIDFLEYDRWQPKMLLELKSSRAWAAQNNSNVIVQYRLAQMADILYRVVESNKNWSQLTVIEISLVEPEQKENQKPQKPRIKIENETTMELPDFVAWLYKIRGYDIAKELRPNRLLNIKLGGKNRIPHRLEPVTFEHKESPKE